MPLGSGLQSVGRGGGLVPHRKLLAGGSFPGLAEAMPEISHHVAYRNAERHHSALGYQSPNPFEARLKTASRFCLA